MGIGSVGNDVALSRQKYGFDFRYPRHFYGVRSVPKRTLACEAGRLGLTPSVHPNSRESLEAVTRTKTTAQFRRQPESPISCCGVSGLRVRLKSGRSLFDSD